MHFDATYKVHTVSHHSHNTSVSPPSPLSPGLPLLAIRGPPCEQELLAARGYAGLPPSHSLSLPHPAPHLGAGQGRSPTKVLPAVRFRPTTKAPCEQRVSGRKGVSWHAPESLSPSPTLALHSMRRGGVEAAWPLLGKGLSAVRFRRHTDEPFAPTAVPSRGGSRTTSSTLSTSSCTKTQKRAAEERTAFQGPEPVNLSRPVPLPKKQQRAAPAKHANRDQSRSPCPGPSPCRCRALSASLQITLSIFT